MKLLSNVLVVCLMTTALRADVTEADVVAAELARRYDEALLKEAVQSPQALLRRNAARAAGRLKDERAVPWLARLTKDSSGPVRRAALFALGQIQKKSVVLPLRGTLGTLDENDLPTALIALGKTQDERAASAISGRLDHQNAAVRGAAAIALVRLGDTSTLREVFGALKQEEDPEARWRQVYAAHRLLRKDREKKEGRPIEKPETWSTWLEPSLGPDRAFEERVFAALALGALGGGHEILLELLGDKDPKVVVAAVSALSVEWDAASAKTVSALARSTNELIQTVAVEHVALGVDKGNAKAAAALLSEMEPALARRPHLLLKVAVALAKAGKRASALGADGASEELLWRAGARVGAVPDKTPSTLSGQVAAAEICAEDFVPKERALALLLELSKSADYTVASTAVKGLGVRGDKATAEAIVAAGKGARGTENLDTRLEAVQALGQLEFAHPWLFEALDDPDLPVQLAARETLQKLGQDVPPERNPPAFRLNGSNAAAIIAQARKLVGSRVFLETNKGTIEIMLLPDEAPMHCVNFARLVERGFYNGLIWHRVVPDFVIQGGCPRGDGWGGPGWLLPDEIGTRPYVRGTVGMPRSGFDTGGCQIFVTHLPTPHLDGRYTVYGQVLSGLDVVDKIRIGDKIVKATLKKRE